MIISSWVTRTTLRVDAVICGIRSGTSDRGTEGPALGCRGGLIRREATAEFARRSRSVNGNTRTTDLNFAPKPCSIRPSRPLARSLTILSPDPGLNRAEADPLSETMQFTNVPRRASSSLISPSRPSKHACFAEFVTSSWTINPSRQHRSDTRGRVSAAHARRIFIRLNRDRLMAKPNLRAYSAASINVSRSGVTRARWTSAYPCSSSTTFVSAALASDPSARTAATETRLMADVNSLLTR